MKREVPVHWKSLMERRGFASYRALALAANVAPATVIRLLNSEGAPEMNTAQAVADALDITLNDLLELHGTLARDHGPVDWPEESRFLTSRQREALMAVIRSMIEPESTSGSGKTGLTLAPDSGSGGRSTGMTKKAARTRRSQQT